MKTNYVAYYRVSTQKQEISGLGLEAQKNTVKNYIKENNLLAEYTEIESGKNNKRVELQKAIEYSKQNNCVLIIAKLDRLSRNAAFVLELQNSNVNFICCDMPDANKFTIQIFALIAQKEREDISDRTKKALAEKKRQGYKLGTPSNLTDYSRQRSIEVKKQNSLENMNNIRAFCLIQSLRKQNYSFRKIAEKLNEAGFRTSRNNTFSSGSVKLLFERMKFQSVEC